MAGVEVGMSGGGLLRRGGVGYSEHMERIPTSRCIQVAFAGALLAGILGLSLGSTPVESWQLAARFTARWSFPLFLLAFTASAWPRLWPGRWTRALVRSRRGVGLGFATAHTVHLGALTTYSVVAGVAPSA